MKKGFTLVEVLAVIVIIAIISTITLVSITNISSKMKEASNSKLEEIIKSAAKLYVSNDQDLKLEIKSGKKEAITYQELINKGYLDKDLKDLKTYKPLDLQNNCVCVTYSNYEYSYNLMKTTTCDVTKYYALTASELAYSNTKTKLKCENVQCALDKIKKKLTKSN